MRGYGRGVATISTRHDVVLDVWFRDLYLTRGTLVTLPDGRVVKAIELSGAAGVLFRRNSVTGTVEAVPWKSSTFAGLNDALHA